VVAMVVVDTLLLLSVCGGGYCSTRVVDTFSLTRDGVVVDALLLLLVVVIVRRMASGRWWWCGCHSQGGGVGCRSTREVVGGQEVVDQQSGPTLSQTRHPPKRGRERCG